MDPVLSSFEGQFQFLSLLLMLIFSTDLSNRFSSFENRMDLVLSNLETRMHHLDNGVEVAPPQVLPIIASPEFSQPTSSVSSDPTLIEAPVSRQDSYERGAVQSAPSSTIEISV